MGVKKYDFGGWASKNDVRCTDGTTIRQNAFANQNGQKVPLVWMHQHRDPDNVLGHCIIENRKQGVYVYGSFNDTPRGRNMKERVAHGDIDALSIYADTLDRTSKDDILHGVIREISLCLSGADPTARIDYPVLEHSGDLITEEAIIYPNLGLDVLMHSADEDEEEEEDKKKKPVDDEESDDEESDEEESDEDEEDEDMEDKKKKVAHAAEDMTIEDVKKIYGDMSEEQKTATNILVGIAAKGGLKSAEKEEDDEDEEENVKHSYDDEEGDFVMHKNVFDQEEMNENAGVLTHADQQMILENAKRMGSFRAALRDYEEENGTVIMHSIDTTGMTVGNGQWRSDIPSGRPTQYAFNDPSMLFPDYRSMTAEPAWISRNMDWVNVVLGGVHHTPFSRIKSVFADITEDEARAKGYLKAHQKSEEIFTLLKRVTDPQTIYKKQRIDRDDVIDITDFNVVSWIRAEMRVMLNEEIARAILIGDGRSAASNDKIKEDHIRPIVSDVPLFNVLVPVAVSEDQSKSSDENAAQTAKNLINAVIRARKDYKGSGNPTLFTTEDELTEMLLIEDGIGHKLYKTETELATALRVSRIVTVEPMQGQTITVSNKKYALSGVIVNLADYNVGTDKGGEINSFDDFDIDYNQYVYLLETRMSGALTKPYSAMTIYRNKEIVNNQPAG